MAIFRNNSRESGSPNFFLVLNAMLLSLACSAHSYAADVGSPAPSFALSDQNGNTVSLENFRGTGVIINVVAQWDPVSQLFSLNVAPTLAGNELIQPILLEAGVGQPANASHAGDWSVDYNFPTVLHPAANDGLRMTTFDDYNVASSYPSFVFVDPNLIVVGELVGTPPAQPDWNNFVNTIQNTEFQNAYVGSDIVVTGLIDQTTSQPVAAEVLFSQITSPGVLTVASSPTGDSASSLGLSECGSQTWYDITTTASFINNIQVCLPVPSGCQAPRLVHFESGNTAFDITDATSSSSTQVCGLTTSLSPFAVFSAAGGGGGGFFAWQTVAGLLIIVLCLRRKAACSNLSK